MDAWNFDEIIDRRGTNAVNVEAALASVGLTGGDIPYKDSELIRMWVADMEFAPPPAVLDAVRARLDRRILGYTGSFDGRLYEALAGWCRERYGWSFPREELVYSPGVVPAIYQIAEDAVGPNGKLIILTPSYAPFARAAKRCGAQLVCSPLIRSGGRFAIDFDDLAQKAADPAAKLLILCNPHNPTGRVWTPEELRAVADIAVKNDLWLVSDEIHCDLTRVGVTYHPMGGILPDYRKLVVCLSASKTFNLAGLCLSEIVIRDAEERRRFRTGLKADGMDPLSQAAHTAAFSEGGPWLDALRAYLDENFALMKAFFDGRFPLSEFAVSEATYLAWADLSAYVPEGERAAPYFARRAGVILEDGSSFVDNAGGHVRMNLAMPRRLLREGLDRLGRAALAQDCPNDTAKGERRPGPTPMN